MIQIRNSLFETNSSSTHALIIMTKKQYNTANDEDVFINAGGIGEYLVKPDEIKFKTLDEFKELFKQKHGSEPEADLALYYFIRDNGYISLASSYTIKTEFDDYVIVSLFGMND